MFALYQDLSTKVPKARYSTKKTVTLEGLRISVYPATDAGLKYAIQEAVSKDAQLVKLSQPFFNPQELKEHVVREIADGKGIKLFKPIRKLPA